MQAYNPRLVLRLSVAQLISWGSVFYLFALLIDPLERDLGLNRSQVSLAFSLALLAEGLMAYPVGRWIDRGHERAVMTAGSLLAGICLVLLSLVNSLTGLYAVWLGLGTAMAAILYSPAFALVTRRFSQDFRRAIIIMTFLGGLASTVFIPLTAWLMGQLGWRDALLCLALLHLLVCAPLHWRVLRGAPAACAPRGPNTAAGATAVAPGQDSAHALMRSAPFLLIGVFVTLMMSVTVAVPAHMVSLLRENGLPEVWVIGMPAAIGVMQVVGRLMLYFFEHRMDLHRVNRLVPLLIPMGLLMLLLTPVQPQGQLVMVGVFVVLYGLGNGMLTIVKGTAIAHYVSQTHVATLNGALGVPLALARAAAPLLLGLMWSPQAGYGPGLWLLLVLSGVALAALMAAQRLSLRRYSSPSR
ncbi:MAG: MFS transporter [Comamonadaceae bacterium CG1_02_60_18]|nr:MAG: MFS transporter [Comamonadaceae bacterium CG1_02_60_18]PIQ56116.1 MAG: MFS transporter [Comamonadaceae bacterium CG12_big_fil_rev_8_21_14_0_65_59_15]